MAQIVNKAIEDADSSEALAKYIAIIWQVLVIIGGLLVFLQLTWGALNWIMSGSNPERLKRAKEQMFNGIFGLVLLILSYALVKLISTFTGLNILNPNWPTL
ncbi:MAG: hypothetical protein V1810_00820 [Candidatus Beckwithbacteria bacterium]